jgi:V-type H+-transporting ATPase subunit a
MEAGETNVQGRTIQIGFVAGVIERKKLVAFERILWRVLRGNLIMKNAEIADPITDPVTDEQVYKNVFVIFAHGNETTEKIRKLSESLGATLYPVDANSIKRRDDAIEVSTRLEDLNQVLYNTNATKRHELSKLADMMGLWHVTIQKEKAVYHSMNMFNADGNRKTLIAEGWVPSEAIPRVQHALSIAKEATRGMIPSILNELQTTQTPPTFHKTNKLTSGFQEIIDSYGMASYQEVNPGLFTVITFPFLFAVMFGDFGHGILTALFGLYLVLNEEKIRIKAKNSEFLGTIYGGRYMILLMGIFSIYTGLIYNDIFSKMISPFPSSWKFVEEAAGSGKFVGERVKGYTYPFGMDWAWHVADNRLLFMNSYKMKMSIIFGVIHMSFATILSLFNHLHFKKMINVYCEFIPQVLFMQCIFGYLVICMIYKWCVPWGTEAGSPVPPGLLNMLIFMFLSPGNVNPSEQLYSGQATVQTILVLVALICVPWMLCVKPYLLKKENEANVAQGYASLGTAQVHQDPGLGDQSPTTPTHQEAADPHAQGHGGDGHEHFDFGEICIHQAIHTIEYCLGCISNTASYLRLWALSLAHAQLSEVLWDMIMQSGFTSGTRGGMISLFIFFPMWFFLTVAILLLMEGLSAFLHALRLHWVEFNSKFYAGGGYKFIPFSFNSIEA